MNTPVNRQNYFELFGLPESFQPDLVALQKSYNKLQQEYHPDRFIHANDGDRLQALQASSIINSAYETLKSPLTRAAYILSVHGIDPEEHNQSHLDPEFLIQQMELRETLEEIKAAENLDALDTLKQETRSDRIKREGEFEKLYLAQEFMTAKQVYNRLQFLYKLESEINSIEEKILDY